MIETIFMAWLLVMLVVGLVLVLYAVITAPFRLLEGLGSGGWSDKEPIIIFSRKTWSWLLPKPK
jgi:hypothetical protein